MANLYYILSMLIQLGILFYVRRISRHGREGKVIK